MREAVIEAEKTLINQIDKLRQDINTDLNIPEVSAADNTLKGLNLDN
ncbi:MAG: hypothetical protein KAJ86_05135 [Alphaproteobacteria bacterium]|nr:hypothetical protein [Alphaproteobacteria bacterium]